MHTQLVGDAWYVPERRSASRDGDEVSTLVSEMRRNLTCTTCLIKTEADVCALGRSYCPWRDRLTTPSAQDVVLV